MTNDRLLGAQIRRSGRIADRPVQFSELHHDMLRGRFRWKARQTRMLVYLAILGAVAAWKFVPRPWHPSITFETGHHHIYSTATREQTEDTAHTLELLYEAYSNRLSSLESFQREHQKLRVKLFKDRPEFRRINPNLGWAEAFYLEPYCRAYFSAAEINPYHWMLHESVHQLNREVAHIQLEKWLEEGLAEYFSTSCLTSNALMLGKIDPNTYPVWWIDELATTPDLAENIRNGSVIPLRAIITNHGGPSLNRQFNLYYLHWWTLTHFSSLRARGVTITLWNCCAAVAALKHLNRRLAQWTRCKWNGTNTFATGRTFSRGKI